MTENNDGLKKARETVEGMRADEAKLTKEDVSQALSPRDYSQYSKMGMRNITAEDVRPPSMFLVQGDIDKTELVDAKGTECPNGKFYIKAFKEVVTSIRGYIIWVRKDHFQAQGDNLSESDSRWNGSRMYRAIFLREESLTPIALTFKKSSLGGLNDLFTVAKSENLPIFKYKVELEPVKTTNKKGQSYFKSVANVIGEEKDDDILDQLLTMSQGFDTKTEIETQDEVSVDENEAPIDPDYH